VSPYELERVRAGELTDVGVIADPDERLQIHLQRQVAVNGKRS
jgi:hypothetical protein